MKKTLLSAASSIGIVTAALLFTGCGDSDSSSSPSSTAGTQTGQFVKGAWKGISYTRSNGVSGTTGVNGTFTYNPGENVTFNFGLGTARWVSGFATGNSTDPATVAITSCVNPQSTGGTSPWGIVDAGKVATVFAAFGVNETGMGSTDLSTLISSMNSKLPTVNISNLADANDLLRTVQSVGISGGPSSFNASVVNQTTLDNKIIEVTNVAADVAAANLPAGYSLNVSNKAIVLSNGTIVSNATAINKTAINAGGTVYNVLGALTGGVSLVSGNASAVAKVVAYNISSLGNLSGQNISVSVDGKNRTYSFGASTYTLKVDGTSSVNGTYNITSDGLGLNLYPSNTTTGGANSTVTFEDMPATGTIAKIWNTVSTTFSAMINSLTEVVYSTVSKVL